MSFTIGELAGRAGVNVQTIRYYERLKLLLPASRKESGYRLYDKEALKKLDFIRQAKDLGFTLDEIKGLLDLRVAPGAACDQVKEKAASKLQTVREKINALMAVEKVLKELVDACEKRESTEECPILKAIDKDEIKT